MENLEYFKSLSKYQLDGVEYEIRLNIYLFQEVIKIADAYQLDKISKDGTEYWKSLGNKFMMYMQRGE